MLPYKAAAHPWPHGTFWVPPLRVRQETEELLELYRDMISYDEGFVEPLMIIVPSICHAQSMNHKSYFLYSRYFKQPTCFSYFLDESTVYSIHAGYMSFVILLALGNGFQQHRPTRLPQLWQQQLRSVAPNGRRVTQCSIHFAILPRSKPFGSTCSQQISFYLAFDQLPSLAFQSTGHRGLWTSFGSCTGDGEPRWGECASTGINPQQVCKHT